MRLGRELEGLDQGQEVSGAGRNRHSSQGFEVGGTKELGCVWDN